MLEEAEKNQQIWGTSRPGERITHSIGKLNIVGSAGSLAIPLANVTVLEHFNNSARKVFPEAANSVEDSGVYHVGHDHVS